MPNNDPAMTWSASPKFRITKFRLPYSQEACRAAVMGPILGRGYEFSSQWAYDELRRRWHAKLDALYAAKWKPLPDRKALAYTKNCPPFGVHTRDKSACCNRDFICPFCYARRYVERPFKRFEEILYGPRIPREKQVLLRPDLKILSFRHSTNGTVKVGKELNVETLPLHWERAKSYIKANRAYEKDLFGADYGTVLFKVYPLETHLGVTRAGVLLVRGEVAAEKLEKYKAKWGGVQVCKANKKNLRDAMVHAFAYSSELMTYRDAGLLARLMEMRGRLRLTTSYWKGGAAFSRETEDE